MSAPTLERMPAALPAQVNPELSPVDALEAAAENHGKQSRSPEARKEVIDAFRAVNIAWGAGELAVDSVERADAAADKALGVVSLPYPA